MCLRHHNDDERLTKPPLRKQWTILSGLSVKDCLLFVFNEVGKFETIRDSSLIHQCVIQSSGSTSPQRLFTTEKRIKLLLESDFCHYLMTKIQTECLFYIHFLL